MSEVQFSSLFIDNEKFRIDDEFFNRKYIEAYNKIKSKPHFILEEEISILTDFHANGSYKIIAENFTLLDNIDYAYMVRTTDLETNNFTDDVKYISKKSYDFLSKSKVYGGELLINKIGTPGKCYLMPNLNKPVSLGMNLFLLRLRKNILLDEKFLYIYFNTQIGQNIINRKVNGTVPLTIDKKAIKSLYIPKLNVEILKKVGKLVDFNFELDSQSKQKYQQAETLLLKTLGLADFRPSTEAINIKKFSESFGSTGRLDAEYYQKKYDGYQSLIHSYPNGYESFSVVCELKDKNFSPKDKTEYKYIELSNIGKSGEITDCTTALGEELPTRARRKVKTNDVVISSIEGSLESCALVTSEYNNALCSTGFYVVNSKKINAETLLVLFKSEPMQALLKKGCSGTILTAISKTELEQIPIPLIDADTQNKIKTLINECFKLKKQSEHLLEVAKTAVEIAIEQDETTAIRYIEENNP